MQVAGQNHINLHSKGESFKGSTRAGLEVLGAFLHLIKEILILLCIYMCKKDHWMINRLIMMILMIQHSLLKVEIAQVDYVMFNKKSASAILPEIIIHHTPSDNEPFTLQCSRVVSKDGRFNPCKRCKMKTINPDNPLDKRYTVAEFVVSLLFQPHNDVIIDLEIVLIRALSTIIRCVNILAQKTDQTEIAAQKMFMFRARSNAISHGGSDAPRPLSTKIYNFDQLQLDGMTSPSTPIINFDDGENEVEHLEGNINLI